MNPSEPRTPSPLPEDLNGVLEGWDELDEATLARLEQHPEAAEKLAALRHIEDWMAGGGLQRPSVGGPFANSNAAESGSSCPPAEDLFDFARGPQSNEALEEHLGHCPDCAELVAGLAAHPPSPLILGTGTEGSADDFPDSEVRVGLRPLGRRAIWPPLLAAAGLAGLLLIPTLGGLSPWATQESFPAHDLLRGEESDLLFPRGKVLAVPQGAAVAFELPQVPDAESYRVEILAHGAGAFEDGTPVANLRSEGPAPSGSRLTPGLYRWRGFATIRGLETEIGSVEFEVVEHDALSEQLAQVLSDPSPEPKLELLRELDALGFTSDARRLAQSLPPSPERDEYLRGPGR